jgi:hypothetical protein
MPIFCQTSAPGAGRFYVLAMEGLSIEIAAAA